MTIDEAIEMYKKIANTDSNCPRYCMNPCEDCVKECKQIAEWLEELKALREKNETLKALYEDVKKEANNLLKCERNKAIDDFVNACKEDILCQTFGLHIKGIERIAEQLKAGDGE